MYLLRSGAEPPQDALVASPVPETKPAEPIAESLLIPLEETLPEGVNPDFYDSTEVQLGWMNHGIDIINAKLPQRLITSFFTAALRGDPWFADQLSSIATIHS